MASMVRGCWVGVLLAATLGGCSRSEEASGQGALPRPDVVGPQAPSAQPSAPEPGEDVAFLGFVGDDRWALFSKGKTLKVYDAREDRTSTWPGHAFLAGCHVGVEVNHGLPPRGPSPCAATSGDGKRLLFQDTQGVHVIELSTGARVLSLPVQATDAAFLDEDRFVAVQTAQGTQLASIAPGAWGPLLLETSGERLPSIECTDRIIHVRTEEQEHVVARASGLPWPRLAGARLVKALDGGLLVVQRGERLELWHIDEPAARIETHAGSAVESVAVSDRWLAWREDHEGKAELHAAEVAPRRFLHFPAAGQCHYPESLVSVRGNVLKTDGTCGAGCLTERSQAEFFLYDLRTGKLLRHERGPVSPSTAEEMAPRLARIDREIERLGILRENAVESPAHDGRYAHPHEGALVISGAGRGRVRLEGSKGAALPMFARGGRRIAAVAADASDGWVWEARTGRTLFHFGS